MIDYELKILTQQEFTSLLDKTVDKCRSALLTKMSDNKSLYEHFQDKYQIEGLSLEDVVKELLYVWFSEFGEDIKGLDNYPNLIYNFCMSILAVDRFIIKLSTVHKDFPIRISSPTFIYTDSYVLSFKFSNMTIDNPQLGRSLDGCNMHCYMFGNPEPTNWKESTIDIRYRGFSRVTTISKLLPDFKKFCEDCKLL